MSLINTVLQILEKEQSGMHFKEIAEKAIT